MVSVLADMWSVCWQICGQCAGRYVDGQCAGRYVVKGSDIIAGGSDLVAL